MIRVIVFNVTFNNISVISWQSVLLVEETRVPGENWFIKETSATIHFMHFVLFSYLSLNWCWDFVAFSGNTFKYCM